MQRTPDLDMKVLKELILSETKSRRDVGRKLDLSKSAISSVAKRLLRDGLINENGFLVENRRGRKTISINPRSDIAYLLGTDIEGSSIRACLLDSNLRMLSSNKHVIGSDWDFSRIRQQWNELLDDVVNTAGVSEDKITTVGVGLPGKVIKDGSLSSRAILGPGRGIDIDASFISDKFPHDAMASNNVFCIAEYERRQGAARNVSSFIEVVIRYGLGAAIFSNGAYLVGDEYIIGELGHMKIRNDGPECLCGQKGCLDTFVSGRTWQGKENLADAELQHELSTRAEFLAVGLANLFKLISVPLAIIDGIYNEYYSYLKEPLLNALHQQMEGLDLPVPEIVFGDQMQFKASMGAALLAADKFLEKYLAEKYVYAG